MSILDNDIKFLAGVGEKRALVLFTELGVRTMRDLLYTFPFRYVDRSRVYKVSEVVGDDNALIQLRVRIKGFGHVGVGAKKRFVAYVADDTGVCELVWFKGISWIEKRLEMGREYIVFGRPSFFQGVLNMVHPEVESMLSHNNRMTTPVQGIYSTTEKLNNNHFGTKAIYSLMCTLWSSVGEKIEETLPQKMIAEYGLMPLTEALYNIHFPKSAELLRRAEYRLKFEELLGVQLNIMSRSDVRKKRNDGFVFPTVGDKFNRFFSENLAFPLTGAQKRVMREIRNDTITGHQMNRLLQGDVGSGKTVIALMTMLLAIDNGFQACLMAPTEVLAFQHEASISRMLEGLGVEVALLTGSVRKKERDRIFAGLEDGSINILIGTHALLEDKVQFSNIAMVVIDEQHRFGVEQRAKLWAKNSRPPHILVMTATPIPRTLAMTLYGDLEVSVIDELPAGRRPIKTVHHRDSHRLMVFKFIADEIAAGRQVYIVYPLIKESEKSDYKYLEEGCEAIAAAFPPPKYVMSVVHGKMKPADKQAQMKLFKDGTAHIMVATTVIEVGVDVPNASVMVIESAERFGLSQLHQLRGRVGRGAEQSYCVLMSGDKLSAESKKRLEAMVQTNDGFELAELDMKMRGSGDINGTLQSGNVFDFKIANIGRDGQVLTIARGAVEKLFENLSSLSASDRKLLNELALRYKSGIEVDFSMIS
ncbi:MAG: ATP-dependent DNA helicase RecG [Rikenellaceae bacterium]